MNIVYAIVALAILAGCASKPPAPSNKCGKTCQEWLNR